MSEPRANAGWSRHVGRDVYLRPDTSDNRVAGDTFSGRYHIPPPGQDLNPSSVLDLGANIGLTAAHYQYMWPNARVVAVEPDAENRSVIAKNFDGLVLAFAVWINNGRVPFQTRGLDEEAYQIVDHGEPTVACATLAHIIRLSFEGPVDFVKMDIEGAESKVLADREWVPLVNSLLVEVHEQITGYGWQDAFNELRSAGFVVQRHKAHPQAVWAWKE